MKFERGRKIRNIKSHVRVCAIVGLMRKERRIVLGVEGGKAYTSEINLFKSLLKYVKFKGFYFIGDKGYDSIEIIREIKEKGVKDKFRKKAKRYSMREDLYKKRSRIESVLGSIKQALLSYPFYSFSS